MSGQVFAKHVRILFYLFGQNRSAKTRVCLPPFKRHHALDGPFRPFFNRPSGFRHNRFVGQWGWGAQRKGWGCSVISKRHGARKLGVIDGDSTLVNDLASTQSFGSCVRLLLLGRQSNIIITENFSLCPCKQDLNSRLVQYLNTQPLIALQIVCCSDAI